jgi:hypothetical protein
MIAQTMYGQTTGHFPAGRRSFFFVVDLAYLDIYANQLNDDDMRMLLSCNKSLEVLEVLDVRSNCITDDGVLALLLSTTSCQAARQQQLRKVWLQDNPEIGERGARALRDALKGGNVHLEYVGFSQEFDCARAIDYYTALNWGGRRLLQQNNHNNVNVALWPTVLERSSKYEMGMDRVANILYHLLRFGPVLLTTARGC